MEAHPGTSQMLRQLVGQGRGRHQGHQEQNQILPAQIDATENRVLAARPEFSLEALLREDYTEKYEAYLTDQFVSRDKWVRIVYTSMKCSSPTWLSTWSRSCFSS